MKFLVTGSTGGLGQLVIKELLKNGYEVVATARSIHKIEKSDFMHKITFIPYDIYTCDNIDLYTYFGKPDSLIHLAWEKLDDYNHGDHLTSILESHKSFIFNLISNGLKDFNGIGTCYEYGLIEGQLEENMPVVPVLPYSIAKNDLRKYVESLHSKFKFTQKWIRIFYAFGETQGRKNLYTYLMNSVTNNEKIFNMSGGEQVRDFLTPLEISDRIVQISSQTKISGIINCCSGKPVKLKDFISNFLEKNNYKISLNFGYYSYLNYEPMEYWGAVNKLSTILKNNLNN